MGHARPLYADYRKATPVEDAGIHQVPDSQAAPGVRTTAAAPLVVPPGRDPETYRLLRHFQFDHLAPHLQEISSQFSVLAHNMAAWLPDGAELADMLKRLRDAKDSAVRAAVEHYDSQ